MCVAPSHVLFSEPGLESEIVSVDFHIGKTDRTKNQVSGKRKKVCECMCWPTIVIKGLCIEFGPQYSSVDVF